VPLRSLTIERYKCFERRQTIELRPLTVLLGRNNSGKSALTRLPLLLATGMQATSEAPIDLEATSVDVAGDFTDLIFGQRPHGNILFGQTFDLGGLGEAAVESVVQHVDEYQTQVVSSFSLKVGGQALALQWDYESARQPRWNYLAPAAEAGKPSAVRFRGLLPANHTNSEVRHIAEIGRFFFNHALQGIHDEFPSIRYVGPFRERPARLYRLPARAPRDVGAAGENAPGVLADDISRRNGKILAVTNRLLRRYLPEWTIQVDRQNTLYSLVLVTTGDTAIRVNLADTGTGVAQVLPILVQRAMDKYQPPKQPVLEIVEQPELHLHPAAHAALADLYIDGTRQPSSRFVVETHSETFVLRIRRRIAEGRLDPADVGLYFVDHDGRAARIRRIELDELGNVDDWPAGIFTEDYDEARALAAAQTART
jgi:hypothetical protein